MSRSARTAVVAIAFALFLVLASQAAAATLESIGEFDKPIFVTSDPGNPNRLFVVEREGRVIQVQGSERSVFADLDESSLGELVSCCTEERGLLSIALAPDFDTSGRFYADYTGTPEAGGEEGDIHVDAFRHSGGSLVREPILEIEHHINANHNGGQLQFGPDGDLYISVGDGGGSGDELQNGQNLESLLGKILRIEPRPGEVPAYRIPEGNPFATPDQEATWSYGLRNPWRFSFDRATGNMVIGDVGQNTREEVDLATSPGPGQVGGAGADYGWNCREGFIAYEEPEPACATAGLFTEPVFDYTHENPGGPFRCAIIGGYVVRDSNLGSLYGRYVYADLCAGEIRSLALPESALGRVTDDRSEGLEVEHPNSFGEDSCGRIYVASEAGTVYRLVGANGGACPPPIRAISQRRQLRLRIRGRRQGRRPRARARITVRAQPCTEAQGRRILLLRGGKRIRSKRLRGNCVARFELRLRRRSTFRAVLPRASGNPAVRSRRLLLKPGR